MIKKSGRFIINRLKQAVQPGAQKPVDRLFPPVTFSRYYHLTQLRKALEKVIDDNSTSLDDSVILDYGCGAAYYERLFQTHCKAYLKADLPENTTADHIIDENGRIDLEDSSVDVVLSTQVLEHVNDPHAMLAECNRLVKDDGLLILSTHGHWFYHPDPTDYWRWTSQGLKSLIESHGFHVQDMHGVVGVGAVGMQFVHDRLSVHVNRSLAPMLSLVFQGGMMVMDKIEKPGLRDVDACVFVVVARKSVKMEEH